MGYIGLLLSMVLAKEMLKLTLTPRLNLIITTVILGLPLIFHLGIVFPLVIDLLGTSPWHSPFSSQKMPVHTWKIQRPVAFRTNYQSYDPYPSRTYNLMRQSGIQNQVAHTSFNGFNRF